MAKHKKPLKHVKRATRKAPVKNTRRRIPAKVRKTSPGRKAKAKPKARRVVGKNTKPSTRRPQPKNRNRKGRHDAKGKTGGGRRRVVRKVNRRTVQPRRVVRAPKDTGVNVFKDYRRNRAKIKLGKGKFDKKFNAVKKADIGKLTKVFLDRNKQADGFIKLPQAAVVTFTAYVKGKPNYRTKMTPPDMVINEENLNAFIEEQMNNFNDDWLERAEMEEDEPVDARGGPDRNYNRTFKPDTISEISIRFIY